MKVLIVHDKELGPVSPATAEGDAPVHCDESFLHAAGGLGLYVAHLEAGLRERGVEVASLVFRERPEKTTAPGRHELPSFRYRSRPEIVRSALRIVEEEGVDVVHLNSMPTLSPELVRRLDEACPVVWTFHDVTPFCFHETRLRRSGELCDRTLGWGCVATGCHRLGSQGGVLGDLLRVAATSRHLGLYRSLRRALVPSEFLAQLLVDHGVPRERVEVLPLFTRFPLSEETREVGAEPPGILFVGRLTEGKGLLAFARALARLTDRSWTAHVVGEGEARGAAERIVEQAGLRERVVFHGVLDGDALRERFRSCRLAVVPSLVPESFGLVGVEAMGFGLPVVAFDAGGVTEWLEHERTGLLVARGDEQELARAMGRLLDDAQLRAELGAAARVSVAETFTAARHMDRLLAIYGELPR